MKICKLNVIGGRCYYVLYDTNGFIDTYEIMKLSEYKSWVNKITKEKHYFVYPFNTNNLLYNQLINTLPSRNIPARVLWSYVGFAPIFVRYLQSIGYTVMGKEEFMSKPIILHNMYYDLYEFQKNAIANWYKYGGYGVIKAPTGSGKTIIACGIIKALSTRTIICVHTGDLLINVWFNTLVQQFTESIKNKIGIVGGGLSKRDRLNMRITSDTSFEGNIKKDIVIATSQTLIRNLDRLNKEKFGLVILDEIHHFPASQFQKVANNIRAVYRLGLSGTLQRPDGLTPMIWGLVGNLSYSVSIRELINDNLLVEPIFDTIVLHDKKVKSLISNCEYEGLDYARFVRKASSSSEVKRNYVIKLCKSLKRNNKKFLLYTDYVTPNDGVVTRDMYVELLRNEGVKVLGISSMMSGSERERAFMGLRRNEIDGLVFGRLGSEGVNIPEVDSVIMCNATASTIMFPQRVGRAMRKTDSKKVNAYIYEILLDIPLELKWSRLNFYEYRLENFKKRVTYL